jgi:hypothetical protein
LATNEYESLPWLFAFFRGHPAPFIHMQSNQSRRSAIIESTLIARLAYMKQPMKTIALNTSVT